MTRGLQDDKALWKLVMTPNTVYFYYGIGETTREVQLPYGPIYTAAGTAFLMDHRQSSHHRIVTNSHKAEKMTIDINTHSKSHRLVLHTQERAEHAQIPTVQ